MAMRDDNWLVADSEDDDLYTELQPAKDSDRSVTVGNPTILDTSAIQTANFTLDRPRTPQRGVQSPSTLADESLFTPPQGRMDSTINNFTSAPSPSGSPIVLPRPRPRPRAVIKNSPADNRDATSTSVSHISDPISMKRTKDSIQPATTTSFGFSDAAGDAFSSFDIAERAKMRSRKKAETAKKAIPPPVQMDEVIELTSDDDELTLKPTKRQKKQANPKPKAPAKPRPKPTLRVKRAAVIPNGSPSSETVNQVLQALPIQDASSSQLPASTLPTIPPSTPPQAREPTPFSSPLVATRKRKRIRPLIAEDDDVMDLIVSNPITSSTKLPPFFAASSSSFPTDSGIEIPPAEVPSDRSKKKQVSTKGARAKKQSKGRKGKKAGTTTTIAEPVEECAGINQELSAPAVCQSPSGCHSQVVRNSGATKKASVNRSVARKGKIRAIDSSEENDELIFPSHPKTSVNQSVARKGKTGAVDAYDEDDELILSVHPNAAHVLSANEDGQKVKENLRPGELSPLKGDPPERTPATSGLQLRGSAAKAKSIPMSELIRRVNSQPSSPFPSAARTYSPFLKSSRTMLARIAPLHSNRRTPPPPPPRPPPPKKSKKQIELEERIEEELEETVDGWSCLTDEERRALRKARIDAELGYE